MVHTLHHRCSLKLIKPPTHDAQPCYFGKQGLGNRVILTVGWSQVAKIWQGAKAQVMLHGYLN